MIKTKGEKVCLSAKGENGLSAPCVKVSFRIRSVSYYSSAFDLLEAETVLPEMDEDFCGFLRSFDDYEAFAYFCINNETVIVADSINGDIISAEKLSDFLPHIREYYEESAE